MKWGLKDGISIYADSGPPRYVLWCCGWICQEVLTFIQIGSGHTVHSSQTPLQSGFINLKISFVCKSTILSSNIYFFAWLLRFITLPNAIVPFTGSMYLYMMMCVAQFFLGAISGGFWLNAGCKVFIWRITNLLSLKITLGHVRGLYYAIFISDFSSLLI